MEEKVDEPMEANDGLEANIEVEETDGVSKPYKVSQYKD